MKQAFGASVEWHRENRQSGRFNALSLHEVVAALHPDVHPFLWRPQWVPRERRFM